MSPRLNLTSSPYAFRAQNVTVGGIIFDSNVDAGSRNITTTGSGLFGFLGSLSSSITRLFVTDVEFSGNINGSGNITTLGRGNFTFTNSYAGNSNTPGLAVGNRTNGFIGIGSTGWYDDGSYFSPSGTRNFYIRSSVAATYLYSAGVYLGNAAGTTVWLRENTITGGNFSITPGSGNTYFNKNGGNFGIGTATPTGKLDVNGNINLSGDNGIITFSPTGSVGTVQSRLNLDLIAGYAGYQGASYSNIRFYTAGSADGKTERMRLTDVGNLGIGTKNATQKLDVRGNINASNEIYVRNGNAISPWLYNQTAVSGTGNISGGGTQGYLPQWSGTSTLNNSVIYTSGGRVGIGITNPAVNFEVNGTTTLYPNGQKGSYNATILFGADSSTGNREAWAKFSNGANWGLQILSKGNAPAIGAYYGGRLDIYPFNDSNGELKTEDGALTSFVFSSKSVGIGTTTPSNTLDVRGNVSLNNTLFVTNTGNVGIGTNAPSFNLDVNGSIDQTIMRLRSGSVAATQGAFISVQDRASFGYNGSTQAVEITDRTANKPFYLRLGTDGGTRLYVNASGSVGIGTTTPSNKLDVRGAINASGDIYFNNGTKVGTTMNIFNQNLNTTNNVTFNNVNIADGQSYLYNGYQALRLANGTDNHYANIFVGVSAGNSTALRQIAIGYAAGQLNTGDYQTAIGYNAGYQNNATQQTAIGYGTGYQNTGNYQTALGHFAGRQNNASFQTVTGYYAGYQNKGASQTAMGYFAGRQNAGDYQTVIGFQAGYLNNATQQTAIGYAAGYSNNGSSQTAIGYVA